MRKKCKPILTISLYNSEKKLFVTTGDEYNIASQVWMVLAKVMSPEENKEIMTTMIQEMFPVKNIATPYMYHHMWKRCLKVDWEEEAVQLMKDYWGKMIDLGADTFWEHLTRMIRIIHLMEARF